MSISSWSAASMGAIGSYDSSSARSAGTLGANVASTRTGRAAARMRAGFARSLRRSTPSRL